MEPLACFELLNKLFDQSDSIKENVEEVKFNKEQCRALHKQIEVVMRVAARLRDRAVYSERLRIFVTEIEDILNRTEAIVNKLAKANILLKVLNGRKYDDTIIGIKQKIKSLSQSAVYTSLSQLYNEKQLKSTRFCHTWSIPFSDACSLCHVTDEGYLVIGGLCQGKDNIWQIRAYDQNGNDVWHWQCLEELGQPSDITQVTVTGPRNEILHYLALVSTDVGKIVLFDPEIRSVSPEPAYILNDGDFKLGKIVRMVNPQRLLLSIHPIDSDKSGRTSQLKLLSCSKLPFTEIKNIDMGCKEILSLSPISHQEVAVMCSMPDAICVVNVNNGQTKWRLEPPQVNGQTMVLKCLSVIGLNVCVSDRAATQLLAASGDGWGRSLLEKRELGDIMYAISWEPHAHNLIVLHKREGKIRVTLFDVKK